MRYILALCFVLASVIASADDDALYRYHYIEAVRQRDMGNYEVSMELFRRCKELKPDASEVNYALGIFNMGLRNDSLGLQLLVKAVEAEPENTEFAERLARIYLYQGKISEGAEVYERLVSLQPDRTDYLDMLMRIYEQQKDYRSLLYTLNRIELQEGQSEDITLSKMHVHSYLGDEEGAYKDLKGLVDAHPFDMNLKVMMGNWLLSNGRKEEALEAFLNVLKEEPDNAQGQMSLMDYYRAQNETEKADSLLYDMLINPRTEPSTRVTLIRDWLKGAGYDDNDKEHVLQMFDRVLALPQKTTEVAEMRVAYLTLIEAPSDSIKAGWQRVLDIQPEYVDARLRLIQLMWADSIDENVIRECRTATEYVPDEPMLYYYLGMAQHINSHDGEALSTLRRAAGCIKADTDNNLSADIYAMMGDVLQKVGKPQDAFAAYDSCLVYNPDHVMCLNNYAYFLSLEKKNLKRAEKMSYRAITANANSPVYLDTYAWILFQQKRYEEARIYIDQALRPDTTATEEEEIAGEILEHAGDIYFRLGDTAKALDFWQKALEAGVDNEATLRKKIKKNEKRK